MLNLSDRFPNWVDQGLTLYKYLNDGLLVKDVNETSTLDQSIEYYLKNVMRTQEPFKSAEQWIKLFDHPYLLRRRMSYGDINTINPYIDNVVNGVAGIDEPIQALKFVQYHVNIYLDGFNTGRDKKDQIEFIFINQTFYGSGPGTIMGLFVEKGKLEGNIIIVRHALTADSTSRWFDTNNDAELTDKRFSKSL